MTRRARGKRRAQSGRGWVRSTMRAALLAVTAVAVIASPSLPAHAGKQSAVQAVGVQVTSAGAITRITSRMVATQDGSRPVAATTDLDLHTWARQLPLRIQTSYQHGDRQGTNLADLTGLHGRFTITIAVQHTSVQPSLVGLDGGRQSYALTGAPLTVMASVDLGEIDPSRVVTKADGDAAVTTGLVSRDSQGHVQVRYAALLVPPALPPTTIFTLVEDTDHFTIPRFDLAVQPGVTTTPMAGDVVEAVLDSHPGGEQRRLLAQLEQMATSLQGVGEVLAETNRRLNDVSANLAGPTLADLQDSGSRLTAQLNDVADRLRSSSSCLQDAVASVTGSVERSGLSAHCQEVLGVKTAPVNLQARITGQLARAREVVAENVLKLEDAWAVIADLDGYLSSRDPETPGVLDIAEQQVEGSQALIDQARTLQTQVGNMCAALPAAVPPLATTDAMSGLYEAVRAACGSNYLINASGIESLPEVVVQGLENDQARWKETLRQASALRDSLAEIADNDAATPGTLARSGGVMALESLASAVNADLTAATAAVLSSIASNYQAVVGDPQGSGLRGAEAQLSRDLVSLVKAIRGEGAGGLVGLLNTSTVGVRDAGRYVQNQYVEASTMSAVGSPSADEAEVIRRALRQVLSKDFGVLGAFGVGVPGGAQITPVFTYQVGEGA